MMTFERGRIRKITPAPCNVALEAIYYEYNVPSGIAIHIGEFAYAIHFYGIILMLGAVSGAMLACTEARRNRQNPELIWDMLVHLIIGAIVGARLWHIFSPPPTSLVEGITTAYYLTHPLLAIAIWDGGLGIPGAVIGGALVMYWYTGKHQVDFAEWLDIAATGVALGQAIGRWGKSLQPGTIPRTH